MPTLNRYARENEKEGFYVRANVGGENPITLQVANIASRIFKAVGYQDGDSIPSKLVWAMYDLDMLYTLSSIDLDSTVEEVDPSKVLRDLGVEAKLTEEERARLISYLNAYSGPDADRVEELREELLKGVSGETTEARNDEWFPGYAKIPDSKNEACQIFKTWAPENLLTRAKKAFLLQTEFVTWSVRTFAAHPNLLETPLVAIEEEEIVYGLEPPKTGRSVTIADARGHDKSVPTEFGSSAYDYVINRVLRDGSTEEAMVKGDTIVHYDSQGNRGSRTLLGYDLENILPPRRSYFGGTNDKNHTSSRLRAEYLSISLEELETRVEKWDNPFPPQESKERVEEAEQSPNTDQDDLRAKIESINGIEMVRVNRISNSGNPVSMVEGSKMVVITGDVEAEKGDSLVVKAEDGLHDHMIVSNVVRPDKIPPDDTKEWLSNRLNL